MDKHKTAIFISGRGSNMDALIEAARDPSYPAEISLVFSNNPDSEGLKRTGNIPVASLNHREYKNREDHERGIIQILKDYDIQIVCLAGYMRRLTSVFINEYSGKIINIHPSLLPLFPGLHTHKRALDAGLKIHGCTVHIATEILDDGPILVQAAVPILPTDTEETLAGRVLIQEHIIYPMALKIFASGIKPINKNGQLSLCNW